MKVKKLFDSKNMIQKNKMYIAIFLLLMALLLSFIIVPQYVSSQNKDYDVLIANKAIASGTVVTKDDVTIVKTTDKKLAELTLYKYEDVVDKTATRDIKENEYFYIEDVNGTTGATTKYNGLKKDQVVISLPVTTLAQEVSGQLRENDIIRIYATDASGVASSPDELKYVRVIALHDETGAEINYDKGAKLPNSISVVVYTTQAQKIVELQANGLLYYTLVSRDDEGKASDYLDQQESMLTGIDATNRVAAENSATETGATESATATDVNADASNTTTTENAATGGATR